jgi:hypothetical protein
MLERLAHLLQKASAESALRRWAVALVVFHLSVFVALTVVDHGEDWILVQDTEEYLRLAFYPLTDGIYSLDGVQSSGKREPGYSSYIMAFAAAGLVKPHVFTVANLWPVAVVQILIYGLVCYLVARCTASRFGRLTGWLTLMLIQASPLAVYQHAIASECMTMILLGLLWMEFVQHWQKGPSWGQILRSACWLGLLSITKSVNVLFIPVLSLLAWIRLPVRFPKVVVFFILSLLPAMAWTARNKEVFGLPIMGSIDGFSSLYRGNILPYYQISSPDHPAMPEVAKTAIAACKNDAEKYLWYKQAALTWLKENPVQYLKQCVHRAAAMFIDLYRDDAISWWLYPLYLIIGNDQLFLTLLLIASLIPLWRRGDFWIESSVLFFLFSTAIYAAVYGQERYLHPAFFLLAPVHAWCLVLLLKRSRHFGWA